MTSRALLAAALASFAQTPAHASSLQDDLTRCLVGHVTPADADVLNAWMLGLMTLSPKLQAYSAMTEAQRAEATQRWADLHTRLLTVDCRREAILAIKADGDLAPVPGLKLVAGGAMRALLAAPEEHAAVRADAKLYQNTPQMDALRAEAGLPPSPR